MARGAARGMVRWPGAALVQSLEEERDRWFLWTPVLVGCGIGGYFALAGEPHVLPILAALVAALTLRVMVRQGTLAVLLTGVALAASLGCALAKLRTEFVRAPILARQIGPAEVKGWIELVEPRQQSGQRLTVRVTALGRLEPDELPERVRFRVAGRDDRLAPGAHVRARVILGPPPPPALPGGYDFGRQAWYMGLGGIGFGLARVDIDPAPPPRPWGLVVRNAIEGVRQEIGRRITDSLSGEAGAIAQALTTGERGGISEATNAAFRDSGLIHVLSISGLHMSVMAGAIFWTLRLILAAIPALSLNYPIRKWSAVGAAIGAFLYLLISGAAPPTQRSYLMISIMLLAILLDRPALALRNVALSALVLLAIWPESLLDIGFQMSYAAVGALVATYELVARWRRSAETGGVALLAGAGRLRWVIGFFAAIVLATVVTSLAVAPFGAYYFHRSQQYAILGNILGLPICDLYIMPLVLATFIALPFGLEALPLTAMGWGIDALIACARFVAGLPGAVASVPAMPDLAFRLMVAGGIWLAIWRTRWRILGLVPIAAGVALAPLQKRADVYIGRDGRAVAIRVEGAGLSALPTKGRSFELARWLEHDGDHRTPADAAQGRGFQCDGIGCRASVKGRELAIADHPAALAEDCRRAQLVLARFYRPGSCPSAEAVVDLGRLRTQGAHAIYIGGQTIRIATVAAARGDRPWSVGDREPVRTAGNRAKADIDRVAPAGGSSDRRRAGTPVRPPPPDEPVAPPELDDERPIRPEP